MREKSLSVNVLYASDLVIIFLGLSVLMQHDKALWLYILYTKMTHILAVN